MTPDKQRRIYDAITQSPGFSVSHYARQTRVPSVEINRFLSENVDGVALVFSNMVARPLRGRLPSWARDQHGNPLPEIPVALASTALIVFPDVHQTGEPKIDAHTNRQFQILRELTVAKSSEKQDIAHRLGNDMNATAEALRARDLQIEAWKMTAQSLAGTVRANERLVEAKDEIILLLKK